MSAPSTNTADFAPVEQWTNYDALTYAYLALSEECYRQDILAAVRGATVNFAALVAAVLDGDHETAMRVAQRCGKPTIALSTEEVNRSLRDEFEAFTKAQGLPDDADAEGLIHHDLTEDQRLWVSAFLLRWQEWERRDDSQRTIYKAAMLELATVSGEPSDEDDWDMQTSTDDALREWVSDLEARVGVNVSRFEPLIETFIGVRNGSMHYNDALPLLEDGRYDDGE